MISQLPQANKRRHIVQDRNQRYQNLEIVPNSGVDCEFERIVLLDKGSQRHPAALFAKNKRQEVCTKARNIRKRGSSSLSKESSAPNSHVSDPEPIFNEQTLAELMELVEHMKIETI